MALAALEPHFWERLLKELGVDGDSRDLQRIFRTKTAEQWERWAVERDLPLAAVRNAEHDEQQSGRNCVRIERRRTPTRGEDRTWLR